MFLSTCTSLKNFILYRADMHFITRAISAFVDCQVSRATPPFSTQNTVWWLLFKGHCSSDAVKPHPLEETFIYRDIISPRYLANKQTNIFRKLFLLRFCSKQIDNSINQKRGVRNELKTCTRFLDFSLISVVLCGWIKGFPLGFLDFSQAVVRDISCVSDPSIKSHLKELYNGTTHMLVPCA